jgi:hypothetical protein
LSKLGFPKVKGWSYGSCGDAPIGTITNAKEGRRALWCRGIRRFAGDANIAFVNTTFEAWPAQLQEFRLVIAAQSWHWIPPAASAERPGGGRVSRLLTAAFVAPSGKFTLSQYFLRI